MDKERYYIQDMENKQYIINNKTFVIAVKGYCTHIVEESRSLLLDISADKLLNRNCILRGSTLVGIKNAAKEILGTSTLLPIMIDIRNDVVFFPISSKANPNNIWVNLKAFTAAFGNKIILENNYKYKTNISEAKIYKQYIKAKKYRALLRENVDDASSNRELNFFW